MSYPPAQQGLEIDSLNDPVAQAGKADVVTMPLDTTGPSLADYHTGRPLDTENIDLSLPPATKPIVDPNPTAGLEPVGGVSEVDVLNREFQDATFRAANIQDLSEADCVELWVLHKIGSGDTTEPHHGKLPIQLDLFPSEEKIKWRAWSKVKNDTSREKAMRDWIRMCNLAIGTHCADPKNSHAQDSTSSSYHSHLVQKQLQLSSNKS
ncbi:hypothetical protein SAICODRAFT_68865 [Saitoella complicata NRRL Y-17804]|uniref:uncharacterized protein n=1 Tax=Saitoella complicata (strain BCRC 22490 / CBS 7301 / JCM 7358 / NBRC 10748 / NRRL Y-17804) TaxID=698492 RepID=UPI000867EC1B|nr:uncharacterized protein SAICODRAFT_68865 [Saitoella complicata NRRL Y-17804]ODQ56550.1 hypothetical protein SAICODRAFT_68865 [Saitoella complicata NRRL Y-17804]